MSSTTQFKTFADLYQGLLRAVRSDQGNTTTVEQAKRYINTALMDIHVGFADKVPWAIRDLAFVTPTGFTATMADNGTPGFDVPTGTSFTQYTIDNPSLGTFSDDMKITALSAVDGTIRGTARVLDVVTAGDPATVKLIFESQPEFQQGDTILVYQDDIKMPDDFMKLAGNVVKIGDRRIRATGRVEFRHKFAGETELGRPLHFTVIDSFNTAGSALDLRKLRVYPIPNVSERGFLSYVTRDLVTPASSGQPTSEFVNDGDEPIIPIRYRHAIFYHALYNWYRDRKDDTRSQEAKMEYMDIMNRVTNDTEPGQSRLSISPRVSGYRRRANRPYRSGSRRRYDVNGSFDRMED